MCVKSGKTDRTRDRCRKQKVFQIGEYPDRPQNLFSHLFLRKVITSISFHCYFNDRRNKVSLYHLSQIFLSLKCQHNTNDLNLNETNKKVFFSVKQNKNKRFDRNKKQTEKPTKIN